MVECLPQKLYASTTLLHKTYYDLSHLPVGWKWLAGGNTWTRDLANWLALDTDLCQSLELYSAVAVARARLDSSLPMLKFTRPLL